MSSKPVPGLLWPLLVAAWPGWLWSTTLLLLPWMQQQQFSQGLSLLQASTFLLCLASLALARSLRAHRVSMGLMLGQSLALLWALVALFSAQWSLLLIAFAVASLLELWRHWLPAVAHKVTN